MRTVLFAFRVAPLASDLDTIDVDAGTGSSKHANGPESYEESH